MTGLKVSRSTCQRGRVMIRCRRRTLIAKWSLTIRAWFHNSENLRKLFWRCLTLGMIGLAVFVWDEFLKAHFIAKRFETVVPGRIYRSGQISKWLIEGVVQKYGIRAIVDLNHRVPEDEHQNVEVAVADKLGIDHIRCPLGGAGTGNVDSYVKAVHAIVRSEQEGKPVLVHCTAGAQRTSGVLACFRILVRQEDPEAVYDDMRRFRANSPRLIGYLDENLPEIAERLVDAGVLQKVPKTLPKLSELR